jgi:hypothetical protein
VSKLPKEVRLTQADKVVTMTIRSLNRASFYQHIQGLYSFVKLCHMEKDAAILNQLEEDARSLIKVISEKRSVVQGSFLLGCRGRSIG